MAVAKLLGPASPGDPCVAVEAGRRADFAVEKLILRSPPTAGIRFRKLSISVQLALARNLLSTPRPGASAPVHFLPFFSCCCLVEVMM